MSAIWETEPMAGRSSVRSATGMDEPRRRFLSADECRALFARVRRMCTGGEVQLNIRSRQNGYVRWARNDITGAGETVTHELYVVRRHYGVWGIAMADRLDDEALRDAVVRAEAEMHERAPALQFDAMTGPQTFLRPELWSDATFAVDAATRAATQERLVAPVVTAGFLSAGFLQVTALAQGVINSAGLFAYEPETRVECSVTVRNAKGTASGWAGRCHRDWAVLDAMQLVTTATEKCRQSRDPVAIEPGRYTVILEPQAVADLVAPVVTEFVHRDGLEALGDPGHWLFSHRETPARYAGTVGVDSLGYRLMTTKGGFSKIGKRIFDARVTIVADPTDPEMPFSAFSLDGAPTRSVTWVEQGMLRDMGYRPGWYAREELRRRYGLNNSGAFRMAPGLDTIAAMIASTERGLLVTRFVNVRKNGGPELMVQGNTSDGLWLIEKGKITGPVKNFRFRESPVFALNNLEAVGPAQRVLMDPPAIVPTLKIKDFSMTSLGDAV